MPAQRAAPRSRGRPSRRAARPSASRCGPRGRARARRSAHPPAGLAGAAEHQRAVSCVFVVMSGSQPRFGETVHGLNRAISCASVYACAMDAVAGLLDGPRARGAFLLRSSMDPPWSLRIQDEAPLTLVAVVRGEAWIVPDDGAARCSCGAATSRSCAAPSLHRRRRPGHAAAGRRSTPGSAARRRTATSSTAMRDLGVRTWGNSPDGATVLLTGTYQLDGEVSRRLLRALPPLLVAARRRVGLAAGPAARRRDRQGRAGPGGRARPAARPAADRRAARLVRAARGRGAGLVPRARPTPSSGRRCGCSTTTPRTRGRSRSLAAAVGVSRAALARRFNELVGEPPMAFLTGWRIALAADLLLRARRDGRLRRPPGRLRQPVRAQHGVQARARRQPAAAPRAALAA